MATVTTKKGNAKKAAVGAAAGAVLGFAASKLLITKASKKTMVLTIVVMAAIGGFVGYKQP